MLLVAGTKWNKGPKHMLDSAASQDFILRIDESKRSLISELVTETPFVAPSMASFAIGELNEDDTRAWTYSSNG
jgi:hypothetical protein